MMTNNRYKIGVCLLATLTVIICVSLFLHNKQTSQSDTWKQVEQSTDTTKVLGLSQQIISYEIFFGWELDNPIDY